MTSRIEGQKRRTINLGKFARKYGLQIGIICVLLVMWAAFIIFAPRTFLSPQIYAAFMSTIPFFAVIALPLTLVVIAGEIDLSFGSTMAISMLAFVKVLAATNSPALAFVASLIVGFLVGLLNGIIVVRLGIPSLVATIGTQFFWRGVDLVITNGNGTSLVPIKETVLHDMLVGRIAGYLPAQMIWAVAVAILMWVLLNRHKFGAHVYLVGDNRESAELMGVNVNTTRTMVFAIVGVAAALGGVLSSLEVSFFWVTLGDGYLLTTLASVFLGGTSVFGGTGTIIGTFVGCFIIGAIDAGAVAIGLTTFWPQVFDGLIIVVSVALQAVLNKRLAR
jgi:simple sugar transport system permease protein